MTDILETYNILSLGYDDANLAGLVRHPNETLSEHYAIVEAIVDKNPDEAEKCARQHVRKATERIRNDLEKERNRKRKN